MKAPIPDNEQARLAALYQYQILDTVAEVLFDDFTHLASQICGMPIALISLIDHDRQWFKSKLGLESSETPRDQAFCAHAILNPDQPLIVEDATADVRFADNPLVTGDTNIRFYGGFPLVTPDDFAIGTLCVIDQKPRTLMPEQEAALKMLSRQVISQLELRLKLQEIEERTKDLEQANGIINCLNEKLAAENIRMGAELSVAQKIQMMILPKVGELELIPELDVAAYMEPAAEVGGDYYDVIYHDGRVKIAIGDVTGHGLSSGIIMLMAQTAVRTLIGAGETNPVKFLGAVNQTLYDNAHRMDSCKNMTLTILEYANQTLRVSGQHEEIIIVRRDGSLERLDTMDLGFPLGLELDIDAFIGEAVIDLQPDDLVLLYTDGIPEATNSENQFYGLERMCAIAQKYHHLSATDVCKAVIKDVMHFIGQQKIYDDITLIILKQR
ncbi:serine phosphatase RsbU, regulator of sigma subunit [Synechococcus sp. PCC 7502]|uniref:PP2C family protein-serine/threonine phosphatase n=1 Tax=Synechococcus sp. PCC 7502 TaxID=1173263 RepID=UPI00029FACE9|nr:SpoIIE family protein phosphatase [Synechococcus sp. PCC 7502]AFY73774.1 serine phosphatase RsbU, regulator of sigma subunit [Synechococcus sp. PCC 7502]